MSLSQPSLVSATTGSANAPRSRPCCTSQAMMASRTTPTLCVLVIAIGPSMNPDSSTHVVPVISPLPFSENQPAKTGSFDRLPRGMITVTPVRTGPAPTFNGPSPEMSVVMPTSTPRTSVIAFSGPGVPSNGTPRSRARGFVCACEAAIGNSTVRTKTVTSLRALLSLRALRLSFFIRLWLFLFLGLERFGFDWRQLLPLQHLIDLRQILLDRRVELLHLLVELCRQRVENFVTLIRRPRVSRFDDALQRGDPVVQHDREVEWILEALI